MNEEEKEPVEEFRYRVDLPEDLKEELERMGGDSKEELPGGESSSVETDARLSELEMLVAQLTKERDQWKEKYLRALADLENSRKRFQREAIELRRYGHEVAVREILPVLDNLERAIESARKTQGVESILEGLEMILRHFYQVLAQLGVHPVPGAGEPFNPEIHEAVQELEREDLPPGTVVQEVQKGFRIHERLLRPARVIVSRIPSLPSEGEPPSGDSQDPSGGYEPASDTGEDHDPVT
jgi:molecular chaperone GrpE